MRIGMFTASQWRASEDPATVLADLRQQVRTARDNGFSSLLLGQHLVCGPMGMFQTVPLLGRLAEDAAGMQIGPGVLLLSMAAGTGIVLRLALGAVSDRIRRFEHAGMAFAACLAVSLTVLLTSTSTAGIGVYFAFWIIGAAGGPMIEALVLSRAFGTTHFATILGTVVVVETIGQIVSPTVAGAIFDASASYDWALIMFVAAFGLSFLLFMLASRQPRPVEQLIPERPLPAGG